MLYGSPESLFTAERQVGNQLPKDATLKKFEKVRSKNFVA